MKIAVSFNFQHLATYAETHTVEYGIELFREIVALVQRHQSCVCVVRSAAWSLMEAGLD